MDSSTTLLSLTSGLLVKHGSGARVCKSTLARSFPESRPPPPNVWGMNIVIYRMETRWRVGYWTLPERKQNSVSCGRRKSARRVCGIIPYVVYCIFILQNAPYSYWQKYIISWCMNCILWREILHPFLGQIDIVIDTSILCNLLVIFKIVSQMSNNVFEIFITFVLQIMLQRVIRQAT